MRMMMFLLRSLEVTKYIEEIDLRFLVKSMDQSEIESN